MSDSSKPAIVKAELVRRVAIMNEASQEIILARRQACGDFDPDKRRDLNKECGYPERLTLEHFMTMLSRNGIANRVNSIYPDECFAVDPDIYENEKPRDTPFEKAWKKLLKSDSCNPLHYAHRADVESGKGSFGVLLLGTDDGSRDFSTPLPGIDENGNPTSRSRDLKLLYLRAFNERSVRIAKMQQDTGNSRFGHPLLYSIGFMDVSYPGFADPGAGIAQTTINWTNVHWSRVIHLADNRGESEVFGMPRCQTVFNRLADADKILGSSGEMLYKGGFPGLSIELDPRVLEAMNIDIDLPSAEAEVREYMDGLQRYLLLIGMNTKPLTSQVADPTPHLTCQLNSIAMAIGAPLRIFMGSEQAQLASGQDVRTWNRRLRKRQVRYLTPFVIRPMIDRFIALGILPRPKDGEYEVYWPDVNMPDEDELSQIADRRADSMLKFVSSGATKMMQTSDFYRFVWGLAQPEIQEIMSNLKKPPEVDYPPPPGLAGDTGVKGSPNSKPPAGGAK